MLQGVWCIASKCIFDDRTRKHSTGLSVHVNRRCIFFLSQDGIMVTLSSTPKQVTNGVSYFIDDVVPTKLASDGDMWSSILFVEIY